MALSFALFLLVIGAFVGVAFLISLLFSSCDNSPGITDYKFDFQGNIKNTLRDPSSATFEWITANASDDGKKFDGICRIRGQNAFGGYVTETYSVEGKLENGSRKIEWVRIGNL